MEPKITNPFGALSEKYDRFPHIVAQMECSYMNGHTLKELRDLVGQETLETITLERGKIVSFDGPCMDGDCKRSRDPEPGIGNNCCRPVFAVQYSDRTKIIHLDEIWLVQGEQNSSLPW